VVVDGEAPATGEVADGVDAPRDVVEEEDAHEATPEQARQEPGECEAVQREPECGGQQQADGGVEEKAPRHGREQRVLGDVGRVARDVGAVLGAEDPADVGVPEPAHSGAVTEVRAVRIALDVGVGVVLAVVGDPLVEWALERHRPRDRQRALDARRRRERAVREQAVVADRDAEARDDVHAREQRKVDGVDGAVPQQDDGEERPEERQDDGEQVGDPVGA
jgi:hypothetical protein